LYEIAGPFFFGAAQRVVDEVLKRRSTGNEMRVVILYMADIPSMDVTGLVALENAVKSLSQRGKHVILCGVQDEPLEMILKADLVNENQLIRLSYDLDHA